MTKHIQESDSNGISLFKALIVQTGTIDGEILNNFVESFKFHRFNKNEVIVGENTVCSNFYFIISGVLRVYCIDKNGNEKTNHIAIENTIITALSSFITGNPSFEQIAALEDSTVLAINRHTFYDFINQYSQLANFYKIVLETAYIAKVKRLESRITLSAQERYTQLLIENQTLTQRVSNQVLASFLDMSQETLSRIKSRKSIFRFMSN